MDIFSGAEPHQVNGVALTKGNTFRENLPEAMKLVPLKKSGYFAEPSKHKGKSRIRIVKTDNPARTALEFVKRATRNYSGIVPIEGKGLRFIMRDGTEIVYRWTSSSSDGSPAVEITIANFKRVKTQKIHFIKRSDDGNN